MKRKGFKLNSVLCSGDWSERDELPTVDPIGDVVIKRPTGEEIANEMVRQLSDKDIEPRSLEEIRGILQKTLNPESALKYPTKFIREQEAYHKSLRERGRDVDSKFFGTQKDCCEKPNKYKNIISNSLKFWSCKNCGADLGDIND